VPAEHKGDEVKFSAGGDKIATRYETDPDINKIKEQLRSVPGINLRESPTNPQVTNPRDHRVEIQLQSKGDQLMDGLRAKLGAAAVPDQALRVEWVGRRQASSSGTAPELGRHRDRVHHALPRFRFDLRFAPGVVVACIHDAMVVIGFFVIFRKEFTLLTVTAVLTIVGYSMNDTVVIYDRIRENLSKHRGKTFSQIINLSVSETLSRTILTSGATMLSVLAFFIWGTGW